MSAKLIVENVGGLRGNNEFKFKKGALNIVEAPNSSGKTSIIKALAGVLSVTLDGKFKKSVDEEAKNLGIKSNEKNPQQGFVNVHSDTGKVELKFDGKDFEYIVKQNGEILKSHKNGNQDFLLAGILSNDSRILKQLNSVEGDEIEPGNFSWAVTELSSAKIFDEEKEFLKDKKDEFLERKYQVDQSIKMLKGIDKDLEELESELETLEAEKEKLTKYVKRGGVKFLVDERDRINEEIQTRKKRISKIKSEIQNYEVEKDEFVQENQESNKKKEEIKNNLKTLNHRIKDLYDEKTKLEVLKAKKIPELKEEREGISGEHNLLITAINTKNESHICPLCKSEGFDPDLIEKRLDKLVNEKKGINEQIGKINSRYNEVKTEIEKIDQEIDQKNIEIRNTESEIKSNNEDILIFDQKVSSSLANIKDLEEKIEEYEKELKPIKSKFNEEDEELDKELTKIEKSIEKIRRDIDRKNEDITRASFKIGNRSFNPKTAKKVYDKIIDHIEGYIEYTETKAEDQKQKAKENFNKNMGELINNLGFTEFKNIKLNDAYQLYVERLDENTGEYVLQQVKTLSTSEKSAIALILQIALKQMYISDLDFLILDDVLANFDDDKKIKILKYLSKKAEDEGWFIILTNLTEEESPLKIKT